MGPTGRNCNAMRLVFVTRGEGKERLPPDLKLGKVDKTRSAPVTALVGTDVSSIVTSPASRPRMPTGSRLTRQTRTSLIRAFARRPWEAPLSSPRRALGLHCRSTSAFYGVLRRHPLSNPTS